jgi:hypothetical protein
MRIMSVSLALLLWGPSAYAQFKASDPYCQRYPANLGCPPPVRIQIIPPPQQDNTVPNILGILSEGMRNRREDERLRIEREKLETEQERLRFDKERAAVTEAGELSRELRTLLEAFVIAHPDWEEQMPRMTELTKKLRPGDTNAFEYLDLIFKLAKLDEPKKK